MPERTDEQKDAVAREAQRRDYARGCLLAGVLEGAALLAAGLWGIGWLLHAHKLRAAAGFGFVAFTIATAVVLVFIVVTGNTPRQRQLRRDRQADADSPSESD